MADETVQLDKFDVSEVPIEQQILPTSRPFNSVFGTDDNIVDVPRNVTIISRQQLSDISISDVLDFSKLRCIGRRIRVGHLGLGEHPLELGGRALEERRPNILALGSAPRAKTPRRPHLRLGGAGRRISRIGRRLRRRVRDELQLGIGRRHLIAGVLAVVLVLAGQRGLQLRKAGR